MSLGGADIVASGAGRLTALAQTAETTAPVAISAPGPLIADAGGLAWAYFAAVALMFFLAFFLLLRSRISAPRIGQAEHASLRPARTSGKAAKTDFFQPAGEDAEITFDEDPTAPTDRPASPLRKTQRPRPAHQGDLAETGEGDATRAPVQSPRKAGAFSGLFSKPAITSGEPAAKLKVHPLASERRRTQEPHTETEPEPITKTPDDTEAERRAVEEERRRLFAEMEAQRLDHARREEEEASIRRAEEERERHVAAARAEQGRLAAEREAEFERRKQAAAIEQRERDLNRRAEALDAGNDNLRREVGEEVDRRFAALSERLEQRAHELARPDANEALKALNRQIEQRLADIDERLEARFIGASGGGDDGDLAAMADLVSRRISEHRESINATIAALSNRIDSFAGAAEEVAALRKDIATLKHAIGQRAYGPSAPSVQLADLVRNVLPPDSFELRAVLANNRKADCLVKLPYPPGPLAIDARFPVETFQALYAASDDARSRAENEFRRSALRHVVDVAERLIVPEETAESALLFLPSESMYATMHERFPDVVQDAYRARVWIVSPTTLMATLHTVRAVMRDARSRESAEVIHSEAQHVLAEVDALRRRVMKLEEDFGRAHHDVRDVLSGADQIYRRAESITKSHRTLADEILDRGSRRIISTEMKDEVGFESPDESLGDDMEPAASEERQPFPLR